MDPIELQARQAQDGADLRPSISDDGIAALDALAAAEKVAQAPSKTPEQLEAERVAAEKATADAKAAEAAKASATPPAKTPEELEAERVAADKAAADAAAAAKASPTPAPDFDSFQLPPHTKPKSAEAFGQLKQAAREQVAKLNGTITEQGNKIAELSTQLEELRKAQSEAQGNIPPEITQELEQLRKDKLAVDVESDPEFKKFDSTVKNNEEAIYKKLEGSGFTAEQLTKVREIGLDNLDWEKVFAKLTLPVRTYIQAKLVENESARENKANALVNAKANAESYVKQRGEREVKQVSDHAEALVKSFPWAHEQQVPADAAPEKKQEIEAGNKVARIARERLKTFLGDRSPARHAELAVGTMLAYQLQERLNVVSSQLKTATAASEAQLKTVTAERDKLQAELKKIKEAEIPRNRRDTVIIPEPAKPKLEMSGAESLDAIAQQVRRESMEE